MAVSDEIREQRAKLKGQGFKAHWDYFWEYYKIHTIVAIAVIIFLAVLAKDILNKKPYALYAMLLNSAGTQTQQTLQDGFAQYAGIDTSSEECIVDTFNTFSITAMDESTVATSQKIMAFMAAGDLDVLVAEPGSFSHYAGQESFIDLRTVFSEEELKALEDDIFYVDQAYIDYLNSDAYTTYITSGEYDKNNKYAVMAVDHDQSGEAVIVPIEEMETPVPVGIYMTDSAVLKECGAYGGGECVAGIVVNTKHMDNARKYIEYLHQ